jgi:3-deoxy-D-manno-octulosonate 8-phosphate phosphatase (KDO 8-P phosphatase)
MTYCAPALSEPLLSDPSRREELLTRAAAVKLAIFDVDGVMTDGSIVLDAGGAEFKVFNAKDGQGLVMLREAEIEVGIISGRRSAAVEERMAALGIQHIYQGQSDKMQGLNDLSSKLGLGFEQIAYVGDDLPDLPVVCTVGLAIAVADADPFLAGHCHWQTRELGGRGAVREVCELLLQAQGKLESLRRGYLASVPTGQDRVVGQ